MPATVTKINLKSLHPPVLRVHRLAPVLLWEMLAHTSQSQMGCGEQIPYLHPGASPLFRGHHVPSFSFVLEMELRSGKESTQWRDSKRRRVPGNASCHILASIWQVLLCCFMETKQTFCAMMHSSEYFSGNKA